MDLDPKALNLQAKADQQEAMALSLAGILAKFYSYLVDRSVPPEAATALTLELERKFLHHTGTKGPSRGQ